MAVKKTKKDRVHTSRDLEDHIVSTGVLDKNAGLGEQYEVSRGEVHSSTHLEDDKGTGKAVVIRAFDFAANPEAFRHHTPSKQELFNAHKEQITISLRADDLKIFEEVAPKVILSKQRNHYRIIVAGLPWGLNSRHIPTLSELANGNPPTNTD